MNYSFEKTKNTHSNAGAAILFAFLGILSCEKAPSEVSEIYFKYNIYMIKYTIINKDSILI